MPDIDRDQVLGFTVSPLELFIRGALTGFFPFAIFRFIVRRDTGSSARPTCWCCSSSPTPPRTPWPAITSRCRTASFCRGRCAS
jgi:hypothetical protein